MSKRNKYLKGIAITLAFSLVFSGLSSSSAYATENETKAENEDVALSYDGTQDSVDEYDADKTETEEDDQEDSEEKKTIEENSDSNVSENEAEDEDATQDETANEITTQEETTEEETTGEETTEEETTEEETTEVDYGETVGELKLVYGDENLSDQDALCLLIMGDGFTYTEQDKFYAEADNTAQYIMGCSPYDEFEDTIKIYALGTVSNAPVMIPEGYVYNQNIWNNGDVLKASLLENYFGQKVFFSTIFSKDAAMMIDMQQVTKTDDVKLGYKLSLMTNVEEKFDVIHAVPADIKSLPYNVMLHFNLGSRYNGKMSYIFAKNSSEEDYRLKKIMKVDEFGNVAFDTTDISDVIIMVEK